MQRRTFLKSSGGVAAAMMLPAAAFAQSDASNAAIFEVRTYHFVDAEQQKAFAAFLSDGAIPAWNQAGVKPVGLFELRAKDNPDLKLDADPNELWAFLPHRSIAELARLDAVMPDSAPAFARYENILLQPMSGSPGVVVPRRDEKSIFELRTYESPTVERHLNKLKMFNAGEFGAFERAGMTGVFFGGAFAASNLPQLTYMLCHPDETKVKDGWATFQADAQWMKLKADPQYKANVSKIIRRFLRPLAGSQL